MTLNKIFVFGSCAASQIVLGLNSLQQSGSIDKDIKIGYWAMPAENFTKPGFMAYEHDKIVLSDKKYRKETKENIFDFNMDDNMENWSYLPPEIRLPLDLDNERMIYIYASPIFPFFNFINMMQSYDYGYSPSYNMIVDTVLETIGLQMELLSFLKKSGVNIIVAEGPRAFEFEINVERYKHLTRLYVDTIKQKLKDIAVPCIAIDESLVLNDNGFTKTRFKLIHNRPDILHANKEYGLLAATAVIKFLELNKPL